MGTKALKRIARKRPSEILTSIYDRLVIFKFMFVETPEEYGGKKKKIY